MTSPPDPVFVLRGANAPVTAVTFFEYDGTGKIQRIAAGTQEGQVFIWDLKVRYFLFIMQFNDGVKFDFVNTEFTYIITFKFLLYI